MWPAGCSPPGSQRPFPVPCLLTMWRGRSASEALGAQEVAEAERTPILEADPNSDLVAAFPTHQPAGQAGLEPCLGLPMSYQRSRSPSPGHPMSFPTLSTTTGCPSLPRRQAGWHSRWCSRRRRDWHCCSCSCSPAAHRPRSTAAPRPLQGPTQKSTLKRQAPSSSVPAEPRSSSFQEARRLCGPGTAPRLPRSSLELVPDPHLCRSCPFCSWVHTAASASARYSTATGWGGRSRRRCLCGSRCRSARHCRRSTMVRMG